MSSPSGSKAAKKSVSFSGSSSSSSGLQMDTSTAKRLRDDGATLVVLDFPVRSQFGMDLMEWTTAEKFKGVKMIPPGWHFVYWR